MSDFHKNINTLLGNIKAGLPKYNFNACIDDEIIETTEKAYGFVLSPSHKYFLSRADGGMILEENMHYYIDMLDDEPDGPIDSSFYLFPLNYLIDKYRDLKLDQWLMPKHFNGLYPIIPICDTPAHELIFMVSYKGLNIESPVFSTSILSDTGSAMQVANNFDHFVGMYLKHNGFPPLNPVCKALSIDEYLANNNIIDIAKEVLTYEQSLEQANAMIKRYPNDPWAYCERGNLQCDNGFRRLALTDFNKAIEGDDQEAFFYYCRGELLLKFGSARKALIDLDIAVKLEPSDKLYLSGRGEAYLKLALATQGNARERKLQRALDDCNAVLEEDGVYKIALSTRYKIYRSMGEDKKAAEDSALLDDLYR